MATIEEIVKKADLLGYRGEKREEYLKQEFKLLEERQEKKEEAERQEKKEEAERQTREKKEEAERQAREKKEEAEQRCHRSPRTLPHSSCCMGGLRGPMHILRELWTKEIEEPDVISSYEYVLNLRERLDDTPKIAHLEGEHFNDSDCEALSELGGWGSEESVNDLKYGDGLTLDQRRQLEEVAVSYSSIFSDRPGTASTEEHCIELTSSIPVRQRQYLVPYAMRQTLRDELREMEDLGIIRKSSSPYASPVVVVKKKDGTNRVCIDYRRLNKLTIFDPQPMTPPADIFQGMEKDQYFSKIDLSKGYWQIPVRKKDIPKTSFVTMDCHYEFLRMPFGMMYSGATLTHAVKKLLCGMDNVVDYIDDLLIHTETWEAHVKTLSELFRRLQGANFTVRPVTCLLGSRTVDFLGHSLGRGVIGLQDENVEKVALMAHTQKAYIPRSVVSQNPSQCKGCTVQYLVRCYYRQPGQACHRPSVQEYSCTNPPEYGKYVLRAQTQRIWHLVLMALGL
ncbi:Zinc finger protein [Plakobranchus ocellatus]|uniref:Zinc finger protein n=1 Tax=Plakobranchus ocellatus TaxID=259542 RepID=A0AAV4CA63_9GAST|nr:Zinc finger protein [Plakobranchus ocellatus]